MRNDPIIKASKGKGTPRLPEDVIILPVEEDLNRCGELLQSAPIRTLFRFIKVHVGSHASKQLGVAGPVLGAPQAVMLLENLVVMGAKRILCFGWCGSLAPDVVIGDFVIPVRAVGEEGTSSHYPLPGVRVGADPALRDCVESCSRSRTAKVHQGIVWTTDAPYRETPHKIERARNQGALAVEMELSALFKAARFHSVRLAALLVVSDELFSGIWKHGFRDERFRNSREEGLRIVIEALAVHG